MKHYTIIYWAAGIALLLFLGDAIASIYGALQLHSALAIATSDDDFAPRLRSRLYIQYGQIG